MDIYHIRVAPATYQRISLKTLTYASEQQAIDVLEDAFQQKNIKFKFEAGESEKRFLNESGGELAAVVCK
jgi:hypothetical protein